jgi:hypothetical protein
MKEGVRVQIYGIDDSFFATVHHDVLFTYEKRERKIDGVISAVVPEGLRGYLFQDSEETLILCVNEEYVA